MKNINNLVQKWAKEPSFIENKISRLEIKAQLAECCVGCMKLRL